MSFWHCLFIGKEVQLLCVTVNGDVDDKDLERIHQLAESKVQASESWHFKLGCVTYRYAAASPVRVCNLHASVLTAAVAVEEQKPLNRWKLSRQPLLVNSSTGAPLSKRCGIYSLPSVTLASNSSRLSNCCRE